MAFLSFLNRTCFYNLWEWQSTVFLSWSSMPTCTCSTSSLWYWRSKVQKLRLAYANIMRTHLKRRLFRGKITIVLAKHMDLSWIPQKPECSSCKPSAGEAETEDPRVVRNSNSMRLSYWKSSTADLRHMPTRVHVQVNTYTCNWIHKSYLVDLSYYSVVTNLMPRYPTFR